jgi:hypothetical protein
MGLKIGARDEAGYGLFNFVGGVGAVIDRHKAVVGEVLDGGGVFGLEFPKTVRGLVNGDIGFVGFLVKHFSVLGFQSNRLSLTDNNNIAHFNREVKSYLRKKPGKKSGLSFRRPHS